MYPILEYLSTYLIPEYYAYFHTNTLLIYPVFSSVTVRNLTVQVFFLGKIVSFSCVLENVMMESAHCTVTSITFRTRGSLKKSNVKPLSITVSVHIVTKSSWEGFLINTSVTVRLVILIAPGVVMSVSISITSLSLSSSVILRLSAVLSACCSFCFLVVYRLWISFLTVRNLTSVYHLSCSPYHKPPLHDFVYICLWSECFLARSSEQNVLRRSSSSFRCSGAVVWRFCISVSANPFLRFISLPVSDFVRFRQVGILGEKN